MYVQYLKECTFKFLLIILGEKWYQAEICAQRLTTFLHGPRGPADV